MAKPPVTPEPDEKMSETLHIAMPLSLYEQIERMAAAQDRTVSGMVRVLVKRGIEAEMATTEATR